MAREFIIIDNPQGTAQGVYDGSGNLQKAGVLTFEDALSILGQPFKNITRDEAWFEQYGGEFPQTFDEKKDLLGSLQAEKQSLSAERDRINAAIVAINKAIDEQRAAGAQTVKP